MREINPELQKLFDDGIPVYSISKIDTMNRCPYEAYLTYVKHQSQQENIYALLGTRIHDVLEKITNGEATEADLMPALELELEDADFLGYNFPKDKDGGNSIKDGWIADMIHFCKTYKAPIGNYETEKFFLYKTPKNHYLQGYIDVIKLKHDNHIDIYDYKTSTKYTKDGMKEHGRQLIIYALGMEQQGYKVDSVSWIFLKYATVTFMGKKTVKSKSKTEISKVIERKKIPNELERFIKDDLEEAGYNADLYFDNFSETNDFSVLPEEVSENYKIEPYVCTYELTDETKTECIKYIDDTIEKWESKDTSNLNEYPPLEFEYMNSNGKMVKETFFCCNLCGHFKNCDYIKEYLDGDAYTI